MFGVSHCGLLPGVTYHPGFMVESRKNIPNSVWWFQWLLFLQLRVEMEDSRM